MSPMTANGSVLSAHRVLCARYAVLQEADSAARSCTSQTLRRKAGYENQACKVWHMLSSVDLRTFAGLHPVLDIDGTGRGVLYSSDGDIVRPIALPCVVYNQDASTKRRCVKHSSGQVMGVQVSVLAASRSWVDG